MSSMVPEQAALPEQSGGTEGTTLYGQSIGVQGTGSGTCLRPDITDRAEGEQIMQAGPYVAVAVRILEDHDWALHHPNCQGIVAEVGGATSHASVVAREENIPCSLNAKGASRIQTGDHVEVDGSDGSVHVNGGGAGLEPEGEGDPTDVFVWCNQSWEISKTKRVAEMINYLSSFDLWNQAIGITGTVYNNGYAQISRYPQAQESELFEKWLKSREPTLQHIGTEPPQRGRGVYSPRNRAQQAPLKTDLYRFVWWNGHDQVAQVDPQDPNKADTTHNYLLQQLMGSGVVDMSDPNAWNELMSAAAGIVYDNGEAEIFREKMPGDEALEQWIHAQFPNITHIQYVEGANPFGATASVSIVEENYIEKLAAEEPWKGLTAFLGDYPYLVIHKEGNTYFLEGEDGGIVCADFAFSWEEPRVETNRLVAATRSLKGGSPSLLSYDPEDGSWLVVADAGSAGGVDLGATHGEEFEHGIPHGDHPGAGDMAPTIEVRAACPHCHSDQHLELMSHDDHPHSDDEKTYACHNCGKWALEHELEVSPHDSNGQDKNPEDVDYEEHDDDADRHQDDHDREREVHDEEDKFDHDKKKKGAVTGEETPSGGPKDDKATTCPHCGSHTIEILSKNDEDGKAEWLCLSCDNTFKAKFRRTAAGKHPNGTRVQIIHPTMKGQKGSITEHAGTDESFGDDLYHILLDNGNELKKVPEVHFTKIKSASMEKTADHIKTYVPMNGWHNGANAMAARMGLEGHVHYPLTGETIPIGNGMGMAHLMQCFRPEHAALGGNNNIPMDVEVNNPEAFWHIWDAPGEGGGGGANRLREEIPGEHDQQGLLGHIVVIAALSDEVTDLVQKLAETSDTDPDQIATELADKGMIQTDEEWTEVRALVNHARGKNPAALSSLQKGAPYPEKSYHNSPDHSPPGQEWPAEVNAVYNACMREGNGDKEKCARIAWAQYHKSEKAHGHGTTEEEGKKKEGDYQPNMNPGMQGGQQQQTPPCPHCGAPTVGTPQAYNCPQCGYSYPESQPTAPSMNPGTAPAPSGQSNTGLVPTFHSHVKSAALSIGEWYTMYSPDYKVPDVIQVVDVNDHGVTANIEGDDKGLFPITLEHDEIERAGYKFEPYSNPSEVKTARRSFTVKEQSDLVNENLEGQARNFHKLNLDGTHYSTEVRPGTWVPVEESVDPLNEELYWW